MKIKKLLIGLLVSGLALSFTGCGGDEVINEKGEKVSSYGQFIEIKRNHYTDCKFCSNGTPILKSAVHSF